MGYGMRVVAIAYVAVLCGCSVQRVPLRDPQASAPPSSKPYDFESEAKPPAAPAVAAAPASGDAADAPVLDLPVSADLGSSAVVVEDLPTPAPADSSSSSSPSPAPDAADSRRSGYRVQVFAGTDADAAERVRRDLETRLGVQASVDREGAYFKVRAGNCVESQACRELQERLRDAGFASVWIVPAQVEP